MVNEGIKSEGIKSMDLNLLRTAVFEKTGIKVDTEDPIFALVALHETVLAESVSHQLNAIDEATTRLHQQTAELLAAGEHLKALMQAAGHDVEGVPMAVPGDGAEDKEGGPATVSSAPGFKLRWMIAGGAVAALSAILTLGGIELAKLL